MVLSPNISQFDAHEPVRGLAEAHAVSLDCGKLSGEGSYGNMHAGYRGFLGQELGGRWLPALVPYA